MQSKTRAAFNLLHHSITSYVFLARRFEKEGKKGGGREEYRYVISLDKGGGTRGPARAVQGALNQTSNYKECPLVRKMSSTPSRKFVVYISLQTKSPNHVKRRP